MDTWYEAIYYSVMEFNLKQDGVAAELVTQDFEGDQDANFTKRPQTGAETYARTGD